jgi:hypothetical protein
MRLIEKRTRGGVGGAAQTNAKRPTGRTGGPRNNWLTVQLLNDRSGSFLLFLPAGEDSADVDEVIADHAETDPALHSAITLVAASVEPVTTLHHADAPFTAGSPFLPVAEPGFLLFPLPFSAPVLRLGMHTRLTPLSCAAFSLLAE